MAENEGGKETGPIYRPTESFNSAFGLFLRSSWISLLFILLLVILISTMDQGGSLVIDLFDRPAWSMLIFLVVGHAFSLVLSHYPAYLQMWHVERGDYDNSKIGETTWQMEGLTSIIGMGLITFKASHAAKSKAERTSDILRGYLGVTYHLGILYILKTTYDRYIREPSLTDSGDGGVINILFVILVVSSLIYHVRLRKVVKRGMKSMITLWSVFSGLLIVNLLTVIVLIWSTSIHGWSPLGFWSLVIHEILSIVMFSLFRYLRPRTIEDIRFFRPLAFLQKSKAYLCLMTGIGWMALSIFILSHIYFDSINPIALMICIFYFFYGVFIIPTKHHFYYASRTPMRPRLLQWLFTYIVPWAFSIVIMLFILANRVGNGLHLLDVAPIHQEVVVTEEEFMTDLAPLLVPDTTSTSTPLFFISAYGGGLKANYWNLLILERLAKREDVEILDNTLAFSGVSGGAVGQAIFLALCHEDLTDAERRAAISQIGRSDFVTMDIAYTCGYDLMREFAFGKKEFSHPDRAGKAMKRYAELIGVPSFYESSYRSFWGARYREAKANGRRLPIILSNSTGVNKKRGIAASIEMPLSDTVFPNSSDILSGGYPDEEPTYSGAVSCSNRFPFLSPAAHVGGVGHFLDGGYFENSGVLTLKDLYDHFNKESRLVNSGREIVFIQIINSKEEYLRKVIRGVDIAFEETPSGETTAIIDALSGIDMLPRVLEEQIREDDELTYVPIYLPFELDQEDINSYLEGDVVMTEELSQRLQESNDRIKTTLGYADRWRYAEPALARLLGERSADYMDVMADSDWVYSDLDAVLVEGGGR